MVKETINNWFKRGMLRIREKDIGRMKSMINSASRSAEFVKKLPINEKSSDTIFREVYEAIRQLGDVKWWSLGYEPRTHDISLEILKELDIRDKTKLNSLDRLKKIRHDLNYRGVGISIDQTKEIIEFWNKCGKDIIKILKKEIKKR